MAAPINMQAGKKQRKKATKQKEKEKAEEKCKAQEKEVLFFPPEEVCIFEADREAGVL